MRQHSFGGGWREPEKTPGWMYFLAGLLILILLAAYAGCSQYLYGDWRCAFAQCRLEK